MGVRWLWRSVAVVVGVVVWFGLLAGGALASSVSLCVPATAGQSLVSGACSGAGTTVALPASSTDQQTLLSILPHLSFSASGVGGQPTIRFSGVNVQIVDGNSSNSTSIVNGTGNLVLGYDEAPGSQTGSHDLILGEKQTHTSYGDIVGGYDNQATSPYAIALGEGTTAASDYSLVAGDGNSVTGTASSLLGGYKNTVSSSYSTLSGGCSNLVGTGSVSVNVDCTNTTRFPHDFASITGGSGNQASSTSSSVTGGQSNLASDPFASIAGGCDNLAGTGPLPSGTCATGTEAILGGEDNTASGTEAAVSGGSGNAADALDSVVSGGAFQHRRRRLRCCCGRLLEPSRCGQRQLQRRLQ